MTPDEITTKTTAQLERRIRAIRRTVKPYAKAEVINSLDASQFRYLQDLAIEYKAILAEIKSRSEKP